MRQSSDPQLEGNRVSLQLKRCSKFLSPLVVKRKMLLSKINIYIRESMFLEKSGQEFSSYLQ